MSSFIAWALLGSILIHQGPRGPAPRDDFAHLAEGLTSQTKDDTIEAGYRMFSAPDFDAICANAHADAVARLRSLSGRVRLKVGHEFDPSSLKVIALDASRLVISKVPIAIEIERWAAPVLEGVGTHIADGLVRPHNPGVFRFRVRTICDAPGAEILIRAEVSR